MLVVDIGGSHVKLRAEGQDAPTRFDSDARLTPARMIGGVKSIAAGWRFDVMALGYPGPVRHGRIVAEPHNLGPGWVGHDFHAAFGCPLRILNDAAMQALGGYRGGRMLFLGLGTGLGSAMVVSGVALPMELAHLPYRRSTFEEHVGAAALERLGKKRWRARVDDVVARLRAALEPDEVLLGGGNAAKLKTLPPATRIGGNEDAFVGGLRLWHGAPQRTTAAADGAVAAGAAPEGSSPGGGAPEGRQATA